MAVTAASIVPLLLSVVVQGRPQESGAPPVAAPLAFEQLSLTEQIASAGQLTDTQWQTLLRTQAIHVRDCWPADVPFAIGLEVPNWLPGAVIRFEPIAFDLARASAARPLRSMCGNCAASARNRERYQELGMLPLGEHAIAFRVEVERRAAQDLSPLRWSGTLELHVRVVATIDEVLPARRDAALDESVRRALTPAVFEDRLLIVGVHPERVPELARTALALELELFEGTESHGAKPLAAVDHSASRSARWELPPARDSARWSLRIRSRPRDALGAWDATSSWDGEIVIPLSDVPPYEKHPAWR